MEVHFTSAQVSLFIKRDFLDFDTCARIRSKAHSSPTTQAPVYIEGSSEHVHETVRKTTSFHPDVETISNVHERLLREKSLLEEYFCQQLIDCEKPQFLHYCVGDFFVRHQDGNTEQLEFDHLKIRRISIVVFLNGFSTEPKGDTFDGGQLNFYDKDNDGGPSVFSLKGEAGLLVAFTADTVHEVRPVTSGERYTIISWFR